MNNKRLDFLEEKFNIANYDTTLDESWVSMIISDVSICHTNLHTEEIRIHKETFDKLVSCDPTSKKVYTQWLLEILRGLIKSKLPIQIEHFILEDLSSINDSLALFDKLKKTKRYKELSKTNYSIGHILDPSNINQFKGITDLHEAVFPFMEFDIEGLPKQLKLLERNEEGLIPFEDRHYLVFIPLSLRASCTFYGMATWCTVRPENGMFKNYTEKRTSYNTLSSLFVIINKDTETLMQIHLETNQVMNQKNKRDMDLFKNEYLSKSLGLTNYFHHVLNHLFEGNLKHPRYKTFNHTNYLKMIQCFDFIDIIINQYPSNIETVSLSKIRLNRHLVLKDFTSLKALKLTSLNMLEFPVMNLSETIEFITLYDNKIQILPDTLHKLKNLKVLNLNNNNLKNLPKNLAQLTPKYGGSLLVLSLSNNKLSEEDLSFLEREFQDVNVFT